MALFCNWNGTIVKEEEVHISPNNRSFRYGDGCFETMKVMAGKILLSEFHFTRLFSSLTTLQFSIPPFFTAAYLYEQVRQLVKINGQDALARVRLVVFRGDGGLYDLEDFGVNFILQSWPANAESNIFNEAGLTLDVFTEAKV